MSVYVDGARNKYGRMKMCHMIATSLDELHVMAERLGLKRKWFQDHETPHYDICQAKRLKAIEFGAIAVNRKEVVELIRRWRAARLLNLTQIPEVALGQSALQLMLDQIDVRISRSGTGPSTDES